MEGKSDQRQNMATHCETVMYGSVRGPIKVETVPVMNGKRAAPKLPNAALAQTHALVGIHSNTNDKTRDSHYGHRHKVDLCRQEVPRRGKVCRINGPIHQADNCGRDGVFDE